MKPSKLLIILWLVMPLLSQQAPQSVTGLRLQYALLNDTSGKNLWPNGIKQQVNLENQFLAEIVKPGSDVGSLVNFAEEFFIEVQNSTNPDEIKAKIGLVERGGTKAFDAVVAAANWLNKNQLPDSRRAIFLFSDGDDNASETSLKKAI